MIKYSVFENNKKVHLHPNPAGDSLTVGELIELLQGLHKDQEVRIPYDGKYIFVNRIVEVEDDGDRIYSIE